MIKPRKSLLSLSIIFAMGSLPSFSWAEVDENVIEQNSSQQQVILEQKNTIEMQNHSITNNQSSVEQIHQPSKDLTTEQKVQQILKQQSNIQPLTFENLENYQTDIDVAMMNEVYQVAEQAKKDAQVWVDTGKTNAVSIKSSTLEQINPDVPAIEKIDVENLKPPVNVEQLVQTIQKDSQNVVNNVRQVNEQQDDIFKDKFYLIEDETKLSWFERWKRKRNLPELKKAEYVNVDVQGVESAALRDNLKAKLETLTVDSVQDFNVILPQLRKLANQAAQAVGYYDANFQFSTRNDGKNITVHLQQAVEPVLVNSQLIEFLGAGEYLPQFQVVNVVPDLEVNDIFHHGLYENTKSRINDAAINNGFFDGYWRIHDVKVTLPENTADILLKYETGERYQLGDVQFRMSDASKPLPVDERILREMITWKAGDSYASWRLNLFSNYLTNSRFFNSVSVNAMTPEPIEKTLELPPDILAKIEEQKRMYPTQVVDEVPNVDESQFAGDETAEQAQAIQLDENIQIQPLPEVLQAEQQQQNEQQRLKQQARETKQVPVIVTLNADQPNSMEIGMGYGTDTGFRTRMQYRRAFINRLGHSLQGNIELSQIRQAGEVRYYIPYHHPINRYFTLLGGYERETDFTVGQGVDLVTETTVAGADFTLRNNRFDSWKHDVGLRYRLDRLTVNGQVDPAKIPDEFVIVNTNGLQESLLASYKASKIYANSATNPTQGFRHHYQLQLGSKHLFTDVDMAIVSVGMGFIYSFGQNENHQVLGRADGSYMFTNDFSQVPYNLRFFAGGDQSIRGFDYKSLSPIQNGFKIGGQALATGSFEYNYQIVDGWRLAVFSDVGNSFNKNFSNPLAYSVGLGVRWQSPVGPIRIDVASGISDDNHPIRLHFFIGSPLQ